MFDISHYQPGSINNNYYFWLKAECRILLWSLLLILRDQHIIIASSLHTAIIINSLGSSVHFNVACVRQYQICFTINCLLTSLYFDVASTWRDQIWRVQVTIARCFPSLSYLWQLLSLVCSMMCQNEYQLPKPWSIVTSVNWVPVYISCQTVSIIGQLLTPSFQWIYSIHVTNWVSTMIW